MIRLFVSSLSMVLVGVGCAFFTHLLLVQFLSAEQYGIFSFILSLSLITAVFSLFGFQNSAVRFLAGFQTEPLGGNQSRNFMNFARRFTLGLSALSALLVYGALYMLGFADKYPAPALIIGGLLVPLMVFKTQ